MPAGHGLGVDNEQRTLPARPDARKRDPERAIERVEPWPVLPLGVDSELLPQGQLHDGLLLATPEEREEASGDRRQKLEHPLHAGRDAARPCEEKEG